MKAAASIPAGIPESTMGPTRSRGQSMVTSRPPTSTGGRRPAAASAAAPEAADAGNKRIRESESERLCPVGPGACASELAGASGQTTRCVPRRMTGCTRRRCAPRTDGVFCVLRVVESDEPDAASVEHLGINHSPKRAHHRLQTCKHRPDGICA